jgi:hypothetical protein
MPHAKKAHVVLGTCGFCGGDVVISESSTLPFCNGCHATPKKKVIEMDVIVENLTNPHTTGTPLARKTSPLKIRPLHDRVFVKRDPS